MVTGHFVAFRFQELASRQAFITVDDRPFYIGECENLSDRFNNGYGRISPRNCFNKGQSTNCRINRLILNEIEKGSRLDLWFRSELARKIAEAELISQLAPAWNGAIPLLRPTRLTVVADPLPNLRRPSGSHAQLVLNLVFESLGLCDDCLSEKSGIRPRQQVNQLCRKLERSRELIRTQSSCAACGKIKTINKQV
jgi:hypothetical protein